MAERERQVDCCGFPLQFQFQRSIDSLHLGPISRVFSALFSLKKKCLPIADGTLGGELNGEESPQMAKLTE